MSESGHIFVADHGNHRIQVSECATEQKPLKVESIYNLSNFSSGTEDTELIVLIYTNRMTHLMVLNLPCLDLQSYLIPQVFTNDGQFVRKFGSKGTGLGQLKGPCGLALDSNGRVIVAERDNHRIHIFDSEGQAVMHFGVYGDGEGKFNCPRHIAVDQNDDIFVSDAGNFRVQKFNCEGEFLAKFGEKGSNSGQLSCPAGIAVDSEGHIAVADLKNLNVQILDSDGVFIKKLGDTETKNGGVFGKPTGLAISRHGNIVVADRGHHKIQVFQQEGLASEASEMVKLDKRLQLKHRKRQAELENVVNQEVTRWS